MAPTNRSMTEALREAALGDKGHGHTHRPEHHAPSSNETLYGRATASDSSLTLNYGGIEIRSGDTRQPTALDGCVELQGQNHDNVLRISSRISSLIGRLAGATPKAGSCSPPDMNMTVGLINQHREALESEARLLGELLADLDHLDKLL